MSKAQLQEAHTQERRRTRGHFLQRHNICIACPKRRELLLDLIGTWMSHIPRNQSHDVFLLS
jgi:hypothetical protein